MTFCVSIGTLKPAHSLTVKSRNKLYNVIMHNKIAVNVMPAQCVNEFGKETFL